MDATAGVQPPGSGQRLRRAERREQILAAATAAFARTGFAATSLEDVAAEAGVSRVILYRHFESKSDLYRAVLDRACHRLVAAVGRDQFTSDSIRALLTAALEDPAGFRLLFHHAAREPEFREEMDRFRAEMVDIAYRHMAESFGPGPDESWARWSARLSPTVAVESVMAWLEVGHPDLPTAAERIGAVLQSIMDAARASAGGPERG